MTVTGPIDRVMPLSKWPKKERQIWLAAVEKNPFSKSGGEYAHLHPSSTKRIQESYGKWLTFLKTAERLQMDGPPGLGVNKENVELFVSELTNRGYAASTICTKLLDLESMARLMQPKADLITIKGQLRRFYKLRRQEKREFTIRGSHELLALGQELMAEAAGRNTQTRAALQFRDGLMIALLALVPLRTSNFMQIRLDSELQKVGRKWTIHIPAAATKTHHPIDFNWPLDLVGQLKEYLSVHRTFLVERGVQKRRKPVKHLWVSRDGDPFGSGAFQRMMKVRTTAAFGTPMNPHSFRDAAATTLATHHPENVRLASLVLGHLSQATTERFYNQGASIDAHRRYSEVLAKFRKKE